MPAARQRTPTAPRALGKFAVTSAPLPVTSKAATRCGLQAARPNMSSRAFVWLIRRRLDGASLRRCELDCNPCRPGGVPSESSNSENCRDARFALLFPLANPRLLHVPCCPWSFQERGGRSPRT
jgi:hypothetical protein